MKGLAVRLIGPRRRCPAARDAPRTTSSPRRHRWWLAGELPALTDRQWRPDAQPL